MLFENPLNPCQTYSFHETILSWAVKYLNKLVIDAYNVKFLGHSMCSVDFIYYSPIPTQYYCSRETNSFSLYNGGGLHS